MTTRPSNIDLIRRAAYFGVGGLLLISMWVAMTTWVSRHLFVGEILNNFRLQISILILGVCTAHYIQGSKKLAGLGAIVSLVTLFPIASNWIPVQQPEPGSKTLSLLSYNVYGENKDRQPVVATMLEHVADVVVVLEYENLWMESLNQLSQSYTYSAKAPRWHGFGIALFSRFPIEDAKIISITKTETDNPIIVSKIRARDQTFLVVAAHFLSPLTLQKMGIRNRQISEVAEIISELRSNQDLPIIWVGDFNCVAWSPFLRDAMDKCNLRDSRMGSLYQGSWPTHNSMMQIPIDNALVSEEIHVHQRRILKADTSDHYPLYLEFSISEK